MRTQRVGNQKIAGRCCLAATALGASGAHDAYRIKAHTFLRPLCGAAYTGLSALPRCICQRFNANENK